MLIIHEHINLTFILLFYCFSFTFETKSFTSTNNLNTAIKYVGSNSSGGTVTNVSGGSGVTVNNSPQCSSTICSYCCRKTTQTCETDETCKSIKITDPADIYVLMPGDTQYNLPYILVGSCIFLLLIILLIVYCYFHKKANGSCKNACHWMWCCKNLLEGMY
jgi:hypothetical protein